MFPGFLLAVQIAPVAGAAGRWAAVPAALQQWVDWGILRVRSLVARRWKIQEFDAVGFGDLDSHRLMKKDDLFWIASMTKPMTAAGILLLADEGKLSLDDPVRIICLRSRINGWSRREVKRR